MQVVKMRNGVKRRKTTTKRRNTTATKTAANPRKRASTTRRKRRNPATSTALVPRGMMMIAKNPKRKTRKRRNGVGIRRNGIFSNMGGTLKTVALGGMGAVANGIVSRGLMTVVSPVTNKLPVPAFAIQGGVEIFIALVPIKIISEKILSKDNSDKVVAGALIKAGLTFLNGALPAVADFNPLANNALIGDMNGQIADDIYETDTLAGVDDGLYDDGNVYADLNEDAWG